MSAVLGSLLAWAGALAFVASLAWFLYSYLVLWGIPAEPGPVLEPVLADVALFSVFALHHSVAARTRAKAAIQQLAAPWLERTIYTWVASLLFFAVCVWWQPVPGVLYRVEGAWRYAAYTVQLAGIVLTARASAAIDVLDLAGVRPVQAARHGRTPRHVPLMTHGPYRYVRHPLYFAWVLFVFGTPHMTATRAVFAFVSTAYLAAAIQWEERGLLRTFGREYEEYRRTVRWRMLPGIY